MDHRETKENEMGSKDSAYNKINEEMFIRGVKKVLNRDIAAGANQGQYNTIFSPLNTSLFVVAGPGSGKTTVMTLRVLRMIFVDGVDPRSVILTTFTRKAASELESRVLGWGDMLRIFFTRENLTKGLLQRLISIDFTRIYVGTIDSLAQDIMAEYKAPGEIEPVVIEDFVSRALMLRYGLFDHGRLNSPELKGLLLRIKNDNSGFINVGTMVDVLTKIKDRTYTDMVTPNQIRGNNQDVGLNRMAEAIERYQQELTYRNLFDFGKLETEFLNKIRQGRLEKFLNDIKFVMVDEYQDTNLLQESIYFAIAGRAVGNGGSITVVGDDDQSLFRFRGATVELFRDFQKRLTDSLHIQTTRIHLSINYRSTNQIIDFVNRFVTLDPIFQGARVTGKPPILHGPNASNQAPPVLVMVRRDLDTLVNDLHHFIQDILIGNGYNFGNGGLIRRNQISGSPSDIAILTYSPNERSSSGNPRLPLLIKERLENGANQIRVFNPRGKDISAEEIVMRLNGLILEIIDPSANIERSIRNLPREIRKTLGEWRKTGLRYIQTDGTAQVRGVSLSDFFTNAQRIFSGVGNQPLRTISITSLIYNLVSWMQEFHNDIVGLAYLELITRAIEQSSIINTHYGNITTGGTDTRFQQISITDAIWNVFVPIAANSVDLNEDLFETLPADRLNIMSFHQAKGLEFPLVIVDIGSEFRRAHPKQAFKRFPVLEGETSGIEDFMRRFSQLGPSFRNPLDRAFDDLIRDFFVGYSRAQDCLLIVGLSGNINGTIPNVASGWIRPRRNEWNTLKRMVIQI
ncbi:MAG: UvrD-helicase domain-containing protein [Thermoplasmatales archaeon]